MSLLKASNKNLPALAFSTLLIGATVQFSAKAAGSTEVAQCLLQHVVQLSLLLQLHRSGGLRLVDLDSGLLHEGSYRTPRRGGWRHRTGAFIGGPAYETPASHPELAGRWGRLSA